MDALRATGIRARNMVGLRLIDLARAGGTFACNVRYLRARARGVPECAECSSPARPEGLRQSCLWGRKGDCITRRPGAWGSGLGPEKKREAQMRKCPQVFLWPKPQAPKSERAPKRPFEKRFAIAFKGCTRARCGATSRVLLLPDRP